MIHGHLTYPRCVSHCGWHSVRHVTDGTGRLLYGADDDEAPDPEELEDPLYSIDLKALLQDFLQTLAKDQQALEFVYAKLTPLERDTASKAFQ